MSTQEEMKACPFCGAPGEIAQTFDARGVGGYHGRCTGNHQHRAGVGCACPPDLKCDRCHALSADCALAIVAWNTRSPSSEEVERQVDRISTHGVGCETWGPKHYECALGAVERLKGEVERLQKLVTASEQQRYRDCGEAISRTEAAEARNTRLQALVGEMREALGPFAKVRTQDLADNSPLEISVCFNREEAEAMNADIDENGWPITKADIAKGTHFPRHSLAMDSVTVGDLRRAHAALQKSEASDA